MRQIITRGTLFAWLLIALTVCRTSAAGQNKPNDLLDQLIELHLTQDTLLHALSRLSVDKRVPSVLNLPSLTETNIT